jgi:hypothetical protein
MPEAAKRLVREFTPEEREHWQKAVAEELAGVPDLIERDRLREAAAAEQSISGQLRRAIAASKIEYGVLAERSGVSVEMIGEFMCGRAALDSDAFGRLSCLLNLQLAQIP